jgi:hypothetical protein
MTRAARLAVACVIAAAGTGCSAGEIGSGFAPPPTDRTPPALIAVSGWETSCKAALAAAATAPVFERFGMIAGACPVCGLAWTPALRSAVLDAHGTSSTTRQELDQMLRACGGVCRKSAIEKIMNGLDDVKDDRTLDKPWRVLAKECPDAFAASPDGRLASAAWWVLSKVARAPGMQPPAPIELPVPAAMVGGADGLDLPTLAIVRSEPPAAYLTVLEKSMRLAPAGRAVLGADGLVTTGVDQYPGDKVEAAGLAQALAGRGMVAILAPHASPAARVVEAVAAAGTAAELHLGVFGPDDGGAAGWHRIPRLGPAPIAPPPFPDGFPFVLGLVGSGRIGRLDSGKIAGCELPAAELDAARLRALLDIATHEQPLLGEKAAVITVGPETTVDTLALAIAELASRGIPRLIVSIDEPSAWAPLIPCAVPVP